MAASTAIALGRTQHRTAKAGPDSLPLAVALDWANGQSIATSAVSAVGAVFDASNDRIVMVSCNANVWITVGTVAAAAATKGAGSLFIPLNSPPVPIYVPAGLTIAALQDSAAGVLALIPALVAQ